MKIFSVPVRALLGGSFSTTSPIISKSELEKREEADLFLKKMRAKAADYLRQTQKKRRHYWKTLQERGCEWEAEQKKSWELSLQKACNDAIDQTIRWQEDIMELEKKLYAKLLRRAFEWVMGQIESKIPELSFSSVLASSIESYLSGEPASLIGTLQVRQEDEEDLLHWGKAFTNLRIEVCSDLPRGAARLITEFFRVELSVEAQLKQILTQLREFLDQLNGENVSSEMLEPQEAESEVDG